MAAISQKAQIKMTHVTAQDFEALFNEHWSRVYTVLFRMIGDPAEAEDLALEVFWRLHSHYPRTKDRRHLVGWLYRVATNMGYNALRARKRREHYENEAGMVSIAERSDTDPAVLIESSLNRQQVRRVLAGMKSRSARLLTLRHTGFSYAEIASVLDVSPGSIGTLLARAEREFEKAFTSIYSKDL